MRHGKRGRKLGRTSAHRLALRRNLLRNFVQHQTLTTTLTKAKEIRPHLEKLISLARSRSLAHIRRALAILGHDRELVEKLFRDVGARFVGRPGGYTRILKLAKPRLGDATARARLELVSEETAQAPAAKPKAARRKAEAATEPETSDEEATAGGAS